MNWLQCQEKFLVSFEVFQWADDKVNQVLDIHSSESVVLVSKH